MTDVMIHTSAKYMTSVITTQEPPRQLPGAKPRARTEVAVEVARATVVDTEAVLAMVARCSRMTLFRRFHGPSDGVAYARAVLDRQPGDETLVAWKRPACIGLATLGRDEGGIAHLGVLVEDAWQRRGVGSRLVTALLDGARAKGVSRVHVDVLGDDRFITPCPASGRPNDGVVRAWNVVGRHRAGRRKEIASLMSMDDGLEAFGRQARELLGYGSPILFRAMGGGPSTPELVTAVSSAGGLWLP